MCERINQGEKKYTEKTQVFYGNSSGQEGDFQNDNKHSPPHSSGLLQPHAQWGTLYVLQYQIVHATYL